jgi:NADH:ubiquinone oxidoreductase subunit 3 (subunit A)
MQTARTIYRYWVAVIFLGVIVQVGLAGYGAFYAADKADPGPLSNDTFDHGWAPHSAWGSILGLLALILLVIALVARFDSHLRNWNIILFVLFLLQVLVLAPIGSSVPALGWLHPINALAIFGISGFLAHRAWRGWDSAPDPAPVGT